MGSDKYSKVQSFEELAEEEAQLDASVNENANNEVETKEEESK